MFLFTNHHITHRQGGGESVVVSVRPKNRRRREVILLFTRNSSPTTHDTRGGNPQIRGGFYWSAFLSPGRKKGGNVYRGRRHETGTKSTTPIFGSQPLPNTAGGGSHHGAMSVAFTRGPLQHHRHGRGHIWDGGSLIQTRFSCLRTTLRAGCLNTSFLSFAFSRRSFPASRVFPLSASLYYTTRGWAYTSRGLGFDGCSLFCSLYLLANQPQKFDLSLPPVPSVPVTSEGERCCFWPRGGGRGSREACEREGGVCRRRASPPVRGTRARGREGFVGHEPAGRPLAEPVFVLRARVATTCRSGYCARPFLCGRTEYQHILEARRRGREWGASVSPPSPSNQYR